jgi:uncharacterized membrane protein
VLVWLGSGARHTRALAALLLLVFVPVALLRLRTPERARLRALAAIPLVTAASLALAAGLDSAGFLLAVPVAINALLLLAFGATLRPGSIPMITRFAHLEEPALTPAKERWCRRWTVAWCAFFVANGLAAGLLAWLAPLSWWAAYTGLLSYGLVGGLIVLERVLRRRRFAARPGLREGAG